MPHLPTRTWLTFITCTGLMALAVPACDDTGQQANYDPVATDDLPATQEPVVADLSSDGSCGLFTATPNTVTAGTGDNTFGFATSMGDVNGDGYMDLLVGDRAHNGANGAVLLYYGSASGVSATAGWDYPGQRPYSNLGWSVVANGDFNGDGYDDIAASDPSAYQSVGGYVYVFYGSATGPGAVPDRTLTRNDDSRLGSSLAAGDINGDDYDDLVVGARRYTNTAPREGAVFLYDGSSSGLSAITSWFVEGEADDSYMGHAVAANGDINGDGYDDIVIGQAWKSPGYLHVYLGAAGGPDDDPDSDFAPDQSALPNSQFLEFGYRVAYAGDTNGDGYDDVIASAPGYYEPSGPVFGVGRVYLHRGTSGGLSEIPRWYVDGTQAQERIGEEAVAGGDVNGDGYADLLLSAVRHDHDGFADSGRVYAFLGGECGVSATVACTVDGDDATDDGFGYSLSTGDTDGDGVVDIAIAAHVGGDPGRVEVFSGLTTLIDANPAVCTACTHDGVPGSGSYCSAECPCDEGEGDCDGDGSDECKPGLTCVHNVGDYYGWDSGVDVCQADCHAGPLGSGRYCSPSCPCDAGEGDCDGDGSDECKPGLTCVHNVGAAYGYEAGVDVCL